MLSRLRATGLDYNHDAEKETFASEKIKELRKEMFYVDFFFSPGMMAGE